MSARVDQAARELLASLGIYQPPVPVEELAMRLGVNIVRDALGQGVSGVLYRQDKGQSVIAVNASHAVVRQRFSIAHEIGHLRLHAGRPIIVDHLVRGRVNMRDERSSLATSREEIEANGFAAALLMPAEWISTDVNGSLGGAPGRTVESLAERYNVSEQAMEFRLVNLGYRSAP